MDTTITGKSSIGRARELSLCPSKQYGFLLCLLDERGLPRDIVLTPADVEALRTALPPLTTYRVATVDHGGFVSSTHYHDALTPEDAVAAFQADRWLAGTANYIVVAPDGGAAVVPA